MAIVNSARLSCRLPPRARRWRLVFPLEAGTGATPEYRRRGSHHPPGTVLSLVCAPGRALEFARGRQTPSSSPVRCARGSRSSSAPGSVSVPSSRRSPRAWPTHGRAGDPPVVREPPARRFRAVDQDPRRIRLPLSAAPLCEPLISLAHFRRRIPRGFIPLAFRSNPNHAGCYRGSRFRAARSRNSSGPAKSWKMRGISSLESPTRFSQNVGCGFQGPFHSEGSHS
jgi:hypothetical protein